jgi:hypothetical protein
VVLGARDQKVGFFAQTNAKPGFSRRQAWIAILWRYCWQAVEKNTGRRNSAPFCNQKGYALASVLVRMIVMAPFIRAGRVVGLWPCHLPYGI